VIIESTETLRTSVDRKLLYPIGDQPSREELDRLGFQGIRLHILQPDTWKETDEVKFKVMAVKTQIFRAPRKDEWYLEGSTPQAWRSVTDQTATSKFWICQLVLVSIKIVPEIAIHSFGAEPPNS